MKQNRFSIKKAAMLVAASTLALSASSAFAEVWISNGPYGGGTVAMISKGECRNLSTLWLRVSGIYVPPKNAAVLYGPWGGMTGVGPTNGSWFNLGTIGWSDRASTICAY
jgi:hypothetical protein